MTKEKKPKKKATKKTVKNKKKPQEPHNKIHLPEDLKDERKISKREKILKMKLENPDMSQREIGEKMGMKRTAVNKHLCHPDAKEMLEEAESRMRDKILSIREKALEVMEDIVVRGFVIGINQVGDPTKISVPANVRASMVKLALEGFLNAKAEIQPESIEFETVISEYGTVEQKVKKNFRNLVPKPKKDETDDQIP